MGTNTLYPLVASYCFYIRKALYTEFPTKVDASEQAVGDLSVTAATRQRKLNYLQRLILNL